MVNLVRHRGGIVDGDAFDTVDDLRSGLLLNMLLHHRFGAAQIAFLQVSYSTPRSSSL
jgi:hypothetical protein